MFFAKIEPCYLFSDDKRKKYKKELRDLDTGFSFFYKFNEDSNNLVIIARKKDGIFTSLPDIIGIRINMSGRIEGLFGDSSIYEISTSALLTYLEDKESKMTEDELKNLYGEDYEKMKFFASISTDKREEMAEIRNSFLDLINEFNTTVTYDDGLPFSSIFNGPIEATIDIGSKESEYDLELSFYRGDFHIHFAGEKLNELLTAYRNGTGFYYKNQKFIISKNDFDLSFQNAIETIAKSYYTKQRYTSSLIDIRVNPATLLKILFTLTGKNFYLDGEEYIISHDVSPALVAVKSDGELEINPEKKKGKSRYLIYSNMMACIGNGQADLYKFESTKMARVYSFLLKSGMDSYSFIKDIFATKLIPTVGPNILAKPKEGDKDAFEIKLYIDLDDNDSLITKTIYKYRNEELPRESIPSNPYIDTFLGAFSKALKELGIKDNGSEESQAIVFSFFKADLSPIRKVAKVFLSDRINRMRITSIKGVNISITKERGWLNASIDSKDYSKDELKSILDAYKKKRKFIILRNDMILMDEEVKKVKDVMDELHMDDDLSAEKLPFFEVYKLKAQENDKLHLNMNKTLTDSLKEISNFKEIPVLLDRSMEDKLRPYQKDAVKWMYALYKNNLDGILADDMGLGKTFETISFISLVNKDMPIIIVCPTSLVYNWAHEFNQWYPSQKCITIEGDKKYRTDIINSIDNNKKIIYVTSYDSLRNDLDLYKEKHFALTIIDEAQFIKNAFALKTKAVKKLDSECRFALTGTPLENRLSDLWSIFDFLMPGYFGSYDKFKEIYENPISADQKGKTKDNLVKRITPFILRRTKKEVLKSLPPKTTTVLSVNMSETERKFYVAYLQKARETLGEEVSKISFLAALTKLREICVDAGSFFEGFKEKSSKLDVAERLIEESIENGHKILIFSSFSTVLHHLQSILKSNDIDSYLIEGATKSGDRVVMAEDFNKTDEIKVMLVSLKAGGTGLNLMGADTVIHLDPWWNFAAEEQATDRAYRIGQLRPVTVYKLVSYDSVEERVIKLQEEKKALYDAVIQNGDNAISSLKDEDIKFILS